MKMLYFVFVIIFCSMPLDIKAINANECSAFKIEDELINVSDLRSINTRIESIFSAKIFYKEQSGYCVPTYDTYLVGVLNQNYPIVL